MKTIILCLIVVLQCINPEKCGAQPLHTALDLAGERKELRNLVIQEIANSRKPDRTVITWIKKTEKAWDLADGSVHSSSQTQEWDPINIKTSHNKVDSLICHTFQVYWSSETGGENRYVNHKYGEGGRGDPCWECYGLPKTFWGPKKD